MKRTIPSSVLEDLLYGQALNAKFKDRKGAANLIAMVLRETLNKYKHDDICVIGIPRGGVVIADILARKLSAILGILIVKRITAPANRETSIGAITSDGTNYLNHRLIKSLKISSQYIDNEISIKRAELRRIARLYSERTRFPQIHNKIVVLTDDGIATGATIIVAARYIRKQIPKRLIIAVPISPYKLLRILKREADVIEVMATPSGSNFLSVDQFYEDFSQVSDAAINKILNRQFKRIIY